MNIPVVETDRLQIRYGPRRVLDDVTIAVPPGSVFAILGRNGVGKTSLMRSLLGIDRPAEGHARLFGSDPWATRTKAMARTGVVAEDPNAPPGLRMPQLSALCGSFHAAWDEASVLARTARMGVPQDVPFGSMSRGQKTSAMLALSLGHHPELLILDDPTLGLDPMAKKAFLAELIDEMARRETTVVITTQELSTVERLADRVAILGEGKVLLNEPMESIKRRFRRLRGAMGTDFSMFRTNQILDQPWGREAVVSDFDDKKFVAWTQVNGEGEFGPVTLEDVFVDVAETRVAS